jgi:hypothetical protein
MISRLPTTRTKQEKDYEKAQAAECNELLAAGWILLGVYSFTSIREMEQGAANETQKQDNSGMFGGSWGVCSAGSSSKASQNDDF